MVGNLELRILNGTEPNLGLSQKEMRFCQEYIIELSNSRPSATAAAKRAGYSISYAKSQAYELLRKPAIRQMIKEAEEVGAKRLGLTAERVLQELQLIAFAKTDDMVSEDAEGNDVVNFKGNPTEVIVTKVKGANKVQSVTVKTVKLSDKLAALDKLGKHLGLFADKVEVTGKLSLIDLITQSQVKQPELPEIVQEDNVIYKASEMTGTLAVDPFYIRHSNIV